jgi:hypothetical protein
MCHTLERVQARVMVWWANFKAQQQGRLQAVVEQHLREGTAAAAQAAAAQAAAQAAGDATAGTSGGGGGVWGGVGSDAAEPAAAPAAAGASDHPVSLAGARAQWTALLRQYPHPFMLVRRARQLLSRETAHDMELAAVALDIV